MWLAALALPRYTTDAQDTATPHLKVQIREEGGNVMTTNGIYPLFR